MNESQFQVQDSIADCIGTLSFDGQNNVVASSGVGENRLGDILRLSKEKFDESDFAVFQDGNVVCNAFRKDGQTVVIYTSK